jgi:hypothetical protein
MIFFLVPIMAHSLGQALRAFGPWRFISHAPGTFAPSSFANSRLVSQSALLALIALSLLHLVAIGVGRKSLGTYMLF